MSSEDESIVDLFDDDNSSEDEEIKNEKKKKITRSKKIKKDMITKKKNLESEMQIEKEEKKPKIKKKQKKKRIISSSEENSDNEEEKLKKRRRNPAAKFLYEEAEISGNDDSRDHQEEEDDDYLNYKNKRKNSYFENLQNMDEEELAEDFKRRNELYKKQMQDEKYKVRGDDEERPNKIISLLSDPKLYMIKCTGGKEKATAIGLMEKYFNLLHTENEIKIISAMSLDKMPGHIIIEAFSAIDVKKAVTGFLSMKPDYVKLIPKKEVYNLLKPNPKFNMDNIETGQFVRINRGLYKGDLAQVAKLDPDSTSIYLKLLPRLDILSKNEDERKIRPSQKLFDIDDHNASSIKKIHVSKPTYLYKRQKFENGFLIKKFRLTQIDFKYILPTLEEFKIFDNAEKDFNKIKKNLKNLSLLSSKQKRLFQFLQRGDKIRIKTGEDQGRIGEVLDKNLDKGTVKVFFKDKKRGTKDLDPLQIEKVFYSGDHVEILSGKHKESTGYIVKIEKDKITIISDDKKSEFITLSSNIRKKTKSFLKRETKIKSSEELQIFNLVELNDNKTVGVILKILKDEITLIDTEGYKSNYRKIQIKNKIKKLFHSENCHNQDVHPLAIVKILRGPYKNSTALVKHVYYDSIFLTKPEKKNDLGIFVETVNNCYVLQSKTKNDILRKARFNNSINTNIEEKNKMQEHQNPEFRKIALIGQKKKVIKGKWKGYEGIIQSINDNIARVELSAKCKVESIPLKFLNISIEDKDTLGGVGNIGTGRTSNYNKFSSPYKQFATPVYNPEFGN